jgi:hypothetical protein
MMPNGLRYPRVGGTRQRRFDGTSFKPQKTPENAATPTRRVHAVLGRFLKVALLITYPCLAIHWFQTHYPHRVVHPD